MRFLYRGTILKREKNLTFSRLFYHIQIRGHLKIPGRGDWCHWFVCLIFAFLKRTKEQKCKDSGNDKVTERMNSELRELEGKCKKNNTVQKHMQVLGPQGGGRLGRPLPEARGGKRQAKEMN